MPGTVATCPSCGKKYRIPEGTQMAEFECKACGGVIPLMEEPRTSRRRGAAVADEGEEGGRRGRRAAPKKSNMPIILGAVGVVLVIVILAIVMSGGDEEQTTAPTGSGSGGVADAGGGEDDVNAPPPPPQYQDYGGEDKTACIEVRKVNRDEPPKPKVKANPDGTVEREEWDRWQQAKEQHAEAMKAHHAKLIEMGKAFLARYPGSEWEKEIAGGVLTWLYKSGDYEGVIATANEYRGKYPFLKERCPQAIGDALSQLDRHEEAAVEYKKYFDLVTGNKAATAGSKWVQALIFAGNASEAELVGDKVKRLIPMVQARIDAYLSPLKLRGKPLPPAPSATPLLSDTPVNWADYRGKVVLVLIWSNQTPEGEDAMRAANKMGERLSGSVPFQIVGIALAEKDDEQKMDRWLSQNDLAGWPQILQQGQWSKSAVLRTWGLASEGVVVTVPTAIILDKTGNVRYVSVPVGPTMEKLIRGM